MASMEEQHITESDRREAEAIAAEINSEPDSWHLEQCRALCTLAGMSKEWAEADGETFEGVVYEAAKRLDVGIL